MFSKGGGQHSGFISNVTFSETKNCNLKLNKNVFRQTASWLLAQAAALFLLGLGFWAVRSDAESGNKDFRAEQWWKWMHCCAVMISLVLFQQLSCTCFHSASLLHIHFSFLILHFSLVSYHSIPCPLLALLPSLFSHLCPWSDALTWPSTGKTLQGHISCRKSRWVSRQAQSVTSFTWPKELGLYLKTRFLVHHVVA